MPGGANGFPLCCFGYSIQRKVPVFHGFREKTRRLQNLRSASDIHTSMKRTLASIMTASFLLAASVIEAQTPPESDGTGRQSFRETWVYLMQGEERFWSAGLPVSDIGYFSARLDARGELVGVPPVSRLDGFGARKHLVLAEVSNQAVIHFALAPEFAVRAKLIASLAEAARPFDGVNVDFEAVPAYDRAAFLSFLADLKRAIEPRRLSVALPARVKRVDDAYDYEAVAQVADRVVIMAYDEHWSGSSPGPVASLSWCGDVANYALKTIGPDKLVMGMPFYGRAWGDANYATAYKHSTGSKLIDERDLTVKRDPGGVPYVTFSETITYTFYYEDAVSFARRAEAYRSKGVRQAAFWRLGQEDPVIWTRLAVEAAPVTQPDVTAPRARGVVRPGDPVPDDHS